MYPKKRKLPMRTIVRQGPVPISRKMLNISKNVKCKGTTCKAAPTGVCLVRIPKGNPRIQIAVAIMISKYENNHRVLLLG